MNNFEHVNALSKDEAVKLLGERDNLLIAGGTDLLTRMKLGLESPARLINLKTIPGLDKITFDRTGLNIGALATLGSIGCNKTVRELYPALLKAIEVTASPQLRNSGTIGGNLAQGPRCWYYRGQFHCWLKQGEVCFARDGENRYHAIFGGGPCYMVHPSDAAPALIALGAAVSIYGRHGERTIPLEELFHIPSERSRRLIILEPDEIITGVHVPVPLPGSLGTYVKAMERKAWAFALASVTAQLVIASDAVSDIRIVLGGVATRPWRLLQVEDALRNNKLGPELISRAADLAVEGARPLAHNGYKIAMFKGIITEALTKITEASR
jgi:xanthine dehydrogenase YagS FAD-binding subunit